MIWQVRGELGDEATGSENTEKNTGKSEVVRGGMKRKAEQS